MGSWWLASRIDATVTRQFVEKQLLPEEIQRLDQPVAFGAEDLTERTYWDSIQNAARRLFLILLDLGIPDQIFGVVDDGWHDAELPLSPEDIDRLQLTAVRDDRVDRRFFQRQFYFLLRTVDRGDHVTFAEHDVVPLDVVDRSSGLSSSSSRGHHIDRVRPPNAASGTLLTRQRYPLGDAPGCILPQEFLDLVASLRTLRHDHITSYWASYTQLGVGYLLLTPTTDFTLKSFLASTPSPFKNLSKKNRRELVMNWILCLADAMCFLHNKGRSHCCIKPSTILFNNQNHISLADPSRMSPEILAGGSDKQSFDREWYDYAAPEQWFRPGGPGSPPHRTGGLGAFSASPDNAGFAIPRGFDASNSPNAMLYTPNPQLNPQQADIFSLGCIYLELLSFLAKRSTGKFATFRSAKHKTAGRGGAVLDTSFHKNLGQVEAWMSEVAKDASKKPSSSEGGNVFRGITPMLHVVAGMLSASPHERPTAFEVQQRIYQILLEKCDIQEPHCVHQYQASLQYSLSRMRIQEGGQPNGAPAAMQRPMPPGMGYDTTPRAFQNGRSNSIGGYSQHSGNSSSNTTASSERDGDNGFAAARGVPVPQPRRSPGTWAGKSPYFDNSGNQASLYASAR